MRLLITGGTGTLGSALARHYLAKGVERLVLLSRDEYKQAMLAAEFGDRLPVRFFLGDVRDQARLVEAFRGIDAVVHAAALKRVDAVAYDPGESIKTNVLGTINVIQAAVEAGVPRVLIVSSDKAVHATNFYGATKFLSEAYATAANAHTYPRGTCVASVRYGNVLGSRGSVIHVWRAQAAAGGPLTLTNVEMTRFVIRLRDAVALVEHALDAMQGGEVFVPVLRAMRLADLVRVMAADAGGLDVRLTGLRPGGEKRHEQLLSEEEIGRTLLDGEHLVVTPAVRSWSNAPWPGVSVDPAWVYRSDRVERLNDAELRQLLAEVP